MKKILLIILIMITLTCSKVEAEEISSKENNTVIVEVSKKETNQTKAVKILIYTGLIVSLGITSFIIVLVNTKKASN